MSSKDKAIASEQLVEKAKENFLEALESKGVSSVAWKVMSDEDGIIVIKADDDNFSVNVESRAVGGDIGRELVAEWLKGKPEHVQDQEN